MWARICTLTTTGDSMPVKKVPYIGVTGFMTPEEVCLSLKAMPKMGARKLMVGVLMSSKTLRGEGNRWPNRYPKREVVPTLFLKDPKALNLIHYNTDNREKLYDDLMQMTELAGPNLDGFQLNIPFPPVEALDKYLTSHRKMTIVLQVGSEMLKLKPKDLRNHIFPEYKWLATHLLIDASGGFGTPLDAGLGREYLDELDNLGMCLGIAGGLGPTSLDLLEDLPDRYPEISLDAEGRLRTSFPEDKLDLSLVKTYLKRASKLFAQEI